MSEWNVPKIREECLKLMGITRRPCAVLYEDASGQPLPTFLGTGFTGMSGFRQEIPDPTKSLDDALPLFKANDGTFIWLGLTEDGEEFEAQHGAWRQVNENPALAVCLLRLELAGHNLDDFRVKS